MSSLPVNSNQLPGFPAAAARVGAQGDGADRAAVADGEAERMTAVGVPEAGHSVATAGGEEASVRAERHGQDPRGMLERLAQGTARGRVPEPAVWSPLPVRITRPSGGRKATA